MPSLIPEESFHRKATPDKATAEAKSAKVGEPKTVKAEGKVSKSTSAVETKEQTTEAPEELNQTIELEDIIIKSPKVAKPEVEKEPKPPALKAETKTVKIKASEIKGTSVSETNGAEKTKVPRKIEVKSSTKDKDAKRRKVEEKETTKESSSNSSSPAITNTGTKRYAAAKK